MTLIKLKYGEISEWGKKADVKCVIKKKRNEENTDMYHVANIGVADVDFIQLIAWQELGESARPLPRKCNAFAGHIYAFNVWNDWLHWYIQKQNVKM